MQSSAPQQPPQPLLTSPRTRARSARSAATSWAAPMGLGWADGPGRGGGGHTVRPPLTKAAGEAGQWVRRYGCFLDVYMMAVLNKNR